MQLIISISITVIVSCLLYYVNRRTYFYTYSPVFKETIYGIVFGLCAVFSTHFGSTIVNDAALSARDVAPVVAGLLFGPWAGVLSGIIGAFDRFFIAAKIFGIGLYTQSACTIATLFAGCFAAIFYILVFKKNRPLVLHALVFILVTEVLHVGLIPLTHLEDLPTATVVMTSVFLPLLFFNSIGVSIVFLITSVMNQRFIGFTYKEIFTKRDIFFTHDLFFSFQFWLLVIIIVSFCANVITISLYYNAMAFETSQSRFENQLRAIRTHIDQDIHDTGSTTLDAALDITNNWSDDKEGVFLIVDLNNQILNLNQKYKPIVDQIFVYSEFELQRLEDGSGGYVYCMYCKYKTWSIVCCAQEKYEMFLTLLSSAVSAFTQIIVFGIMMFAVFVLLKKLVGQNLQKINNSLEIITSGQLDEKVDVYTHKEFAMLSDNINATVNTLKEYIDEEANRYNEEFELARQIQFSAMPNVFPPFPNNSEIDIYARFSPAKIIGGDFYDYYFVSSHEIAFLIADVSGKGIPAAMFMMRAKMSFKVFIDKHRDAAQALIAVNNYLCKNNEAEMFVTAWLGIIDLESGHLQYSTAGHNPPILLQDGDKKAKLLKTPISLVLGGMENIQYKNAEYIMKPGEKLFLYTDGVTEANNNKQELFGEKRLVKLLEDCSDLSIKLICDKIFDEVVSFADTAEQFDDITILTLIYNGVRFTNLDNDYVENKISVLSSIDNLQSVLNRVEGVIKNCNCPKSIIAPVNVAIDEIYSNIVKHGYKAEDKYIIIKVSVDRRQTKKILKLTFMDSAIQFNPLQLTSPDTKLDAEHRKQGGLGIFMVRQIMDDVYYEYKNGVNSLTLVKYYE